MKPTAIYMSECRYTKESIQAIVEAFDTTIISGSDQLTVQQSDGVEVLFAPIGMILNPLAFHTLKYIVQNSTHPDVMPTDLQARSRVEIISLTGPQTVLEAITSTAEHTLGLIHAAHRLIPAAGRDIVNKARWDRYSWAAPKMLSRMTLGIVGYGRVGQHLAGRAAPLFKRVLFSDPAWEDTCVPLTELAERSEVLSIHAGPREGTMPLINQQILDKLPKDAIVINTARPGLLDESYLLLLMKQGRIRAAALDCINWELDKSKPLMLDPLVQYAKDHDNLILTPHIAGSTLDAWRETEMAVIEQVKERYT